MKISNRHRGLFEELVHNIMDDSGAVGLIVSVFNHEGCVLYENRFGCRDKKKDLPIDEDTIFGLASITKSFTSLAVMQLMEKGIIDIDKPVNCYLPEFEARDGKITVSQLMSHSAGFYPLPRILVKDTADEMGLKENPKRDFAYDELLAVGGAAQVIDRLNAQTEFNGEPGRYLSYSNDSYAVLSEIIRRYGGEKSYSEYVYKYITKPLGMDRTWCDFIKTAEDENTSCLYSGKNADEEGTKNFYDNAFVLMGGGAMKSTLKDMKKYVTMYLNYGKSLSGKRIVQDRSIECMEKIRLLFSEQNYYGYGLSTTFSGNLTLIGHGGSLTGVSAHMLWSREINKGAIVLCNTSGVNVMAAAQAAIKMAAGIEPEVSKMAYIPYNWSLETNRSLQGIYESGEGHLIEIELKDGERFTFTEQGQEKEIIPLNELWGAVIGNLTDGRFGLIRDENRQIKAIRYGGRIIKKTK